MIAHGLITARTMTGHKAPPGKSCQKPLGVRRQSRNFRILKLLMIH